MRNKLCFLLIMVSLIGALNGRGKNLQARLDSVLENRYDKSLPGVSVIIAKDGVKLYEKYIGIKDFNNKTKIDSVTRFNIASISKQFTVAAILLLQEQGKLNIDDKLIKYFPNLDNKIFGEITLRHLMCHTSGIPDSRPRNNREWMLTATDKESIKYLPTVKDLKFKPGEYYDYINPTFQILFSIIEKLSNDSFVNFQTKNFFEPLNMGNTHYFDCNIDVQQSAHGYVLEEASNSDRDVVKTNVYSKAPYIDAAGREWQEYDYGEETFFATKADGGIYSTVNDIFKWHKSLLNNKILSQKSIKAAFSKNIIVSGSPFCTYQNRENTYYGLGFFIEDLANFPLKIYHTGDNGGFQGYSGLFPDKKVSVIILENRNDLDRWELVMTIDNILKEEGII